MQEQEPDSPLNDPIGVEGAPFSIDTQIVDSPVRHTTDGKEVICLIYFFYKKHELRIFPDVCRCPC